LPKIFGDLLLLMKKFLVLSLLIFLTICSCQKQDSTAEKDLAQRKTELDARESALDERMNVLDGKLKALDERVRALAENQRAMANGGTGLTSVPSGTPDPAQEQAERERIQQFSAQVRARMADPVRMKAEKAEKDRRSEERRAQSQPSLEQLQGQKQRKSQMYNGAVLPAPQTNPSTPSSAVESSAGNPLPATETTSPTPSPTPE
jgi:hypothetical protein